MGVGFARNSAARETFSAAQTLGCGAGFCAVVVELCDTAAGWRQPGKLLRQKSKNSLPMFRFI
ncbi:MAG: hypothetical protein HYR56_08435 [Acidobacteria bacterium]|nr:hypothetical protein [Acidobacteriota bacterium]MBI3425554.1 hypothetical protein [Acidobacteriota bacterium]